jgi:ABC-2 type transport system permease protein
MDNVAFVLNTLDALAGDDRFIDIRKRRPAHRTLTAVEQRTEQARKEANDRSEQFITSFETSKAEEEAKLQARIAEIQARQDVDPQQMIIEVATQQQVGQQRLETAVQRLERQRDRELEKIQRDLSLAVRHTEDHYKLLAVLLPPIPPLVLAIVVLLYRLRLENVGVAKSRLA